MTSSSYTINSSAFQAQELADKLLQASGDLPAGYWEIQLDSLGKENPQRFWYLGLSQGRIVFSGAEQPTWVVFFKLLKRYIPRLQSASVQLQLQAIKQGLKAEQRALPIILLSQMVAKGLIEYREITQALQLQVLTDLDTYFNDSGQARFVPNTHLLTLPQSTGLELASLLAEAKQRQLQWKQLEPYVPSIESIPKLDLEAVRQKLTERQRQQLQQLVGQGKPIREIAYGLGKDPLKVAQKFVSLSQQGFITFSKVGTKTALTLLKPEIFIVDDSLIILRQFMSLVTRLGYQVNCCNDALIAVSTMLASKPAAIFLDVNMPGASGFQLIKQIRLQPQLAAVPLVILTAEKSISNKMRAKWAKSIYLTKPLDMSEIPTFFAQLRSLLQEIAPLSPQASCQLLDRQLSHDESH